MKQLSEAELIRQRRAKRSWWRKNKSKAALAKKAEQLNGKSASVDLPAIIKAYQTLHGATNDGQIKADITKTFAAIVSKSV